MSHLEFAFGLMVYVIASMIGSLYHARPWSRSSWLLSTVYCAYATHEGNRSCLHTPGNPSGAFSQMGGVIFHLLFFLAPITWAVVSPGQLGSDLSILIHNDLRGELFLP